MKKSFTKAIFILSLLSILASVLVLTSCSRIPNYKKYRTELNKIDTVTVDGNELTAYFFQIKNGDAIVDICNSEKDLLQSVTLPFEGNEYYSSLDFSFAFKGARFQDMNFDSHPDLYIPLSVTTPNLEGMAWLWDTEEKTFVLSDELSHLFELTVDTKNEKIISRDYTAPEGTLRREYMWKDGKLTLVGEYTDTE